MDGFIMSSAGGGSPGRAESACSVSHQLFSVATTASRGNAVGKVSFTSISITPPCTNHGSNRSELQRGSLFVLFVWGAHDRMDFERFFPQTPLMCRLFLSGPSPKSVNFLTIRPGSGQASEGPLSENSQVSDKDSHPPRQQLIPISYLRERQLSRERFPEPDRPECPRSRRSETAPLM